jgi:hypothetical protein
MDDDDDDNDDDEGGFGSATAPTRSSSSSWSKGAAPPGTLYGVVSVQSASPLFHPSTPSPVPVMTVAAVPGRGVEPDTEASPQWVSGPNPVETSDHAPRPEPGLDEYGTTAVSPTTGPVGEDEGTGAAGDGARMAVAGAGVSSSVRCDHIRLMPMAMYRATSGQIASTIGDVILVRKVTMGLGGFEMP